MRRLSLALAVALALAACGEEGRSPSSFCRTLRTEQAGLGASVATPDQVRTVVDRYRRLDGVTPEVIRDDWHQITELVARAAALDVGVAQAEAGLNEAAHAASGAVARVKTYAADTCGVDIGSALGPPATTEATTAAATTPAATPAATGPASTTSATAARAATPPAATATTAPAATATAAAATATSAPAATAAAATSAPGATAAAATTAPTAVRTTATVSR